MYAVKILTIVAGMSLNPFEGAIIFEVTGKQTKSSGVLVYMSGTSSTSAKTDVNSRLSTTLWQSDRQQDCEKVALLHGNGRRHVRMHLTKVRMGARTYFGRRDAVILTGIHDACVKE